MKLPTASRKRLSLRFCGQQIRVVSACSQQTQTSCQETVCDGQSKQPGGADTPVGGRPALDTRPLPRSRGSAEKEARSACLLSSGNIKGLLLARNDTCDTCLWLNTQRYQSVGMHPEHHCGRSA